MMKDIGSVNNTKSKWRIHDYRSFKYKQNGQEIIVKGTLHSTNCDGFVNMGGDYENRSCRHCAQVILH